MMALTVQVLLGTLLIDPPPLVPPSVFEENPPAPKVVAPIQPAPLTPPSTDPPGQPSNELLRHPRTWDPFQPLGDGHEGTPAPFAPYHPGLPVIPTPNGPPPLPSAARPTLLKTQDAFWKMPSITPVPLNDQRFENGYDHGVPIAREWVFDLPAHFGLPRFGALGEAILTDGVLIYEGMRFRAKADGEFELGFLTTSIGVPVTLYLQLVFTERVTGAPFAITIPPLALKGPYSMFGNDTSTTRLIRHVGHSNLLAERLANHCDLILTRIGTARFGTLPLASR